MAAVRRTALGLVLTVGLLAGMTGWAGAQSIPGNAGNLEDGGPVEPGDVLAVRNAGLDWLPTAGQILTADCVASADPPQLIEQNGIVLIRGWGHWDCNTRLPSSYLEVCLDAVFPSVSCNEEYVLPPSTSISLPVDFPCVPGVYLTMASGTNPFDVRRTNDTAHSSHALVVLPHECEYLEASP